MPSDIATIAIAFLIAANCGSLGAFLIWRKQGMVADGVAHSLLPGIVVAFLVSGSNAESIISVGAFLSGVLMVLFVGFLHHHMGINKGGALGTAFTFFLSLGMVLLSYYADSVDLDPDCVLYGELASAHFNRWVWGGQVMGPMALYLLGGLLLFNMLFIGLSYRSLLITSFDKDFALTMGIRTAWWDYALQGVVVLTTVIVFRIAGAPLIIGFLVLPALIAHLFVTELWEMVLYTFPIALIMAVGGFELVTWVDGSLAASMVVVGTVLFGCSLIATHVSRG